VSRLVVHLENKKGYLTKKGAIVKSWRKRWFVVENGQLSYYKAKGDTSPQGSISFKDFISVGQCRLFSVLLTTTLSSLLTSRSQEQLKKDGDDKRQHVLSLVTLERVYLFQAETDEVRKEDNSIIATTQPSRLC